MVYNLQKLNYLEVELLGTFSMLHYNVCFPECLLKSVEEIVKYQWLTLVTEVSLVTFLVLRVIYNRVESHVISADGPQFAPGFSRKTDIEMKQDFMFSHSGLLATTEMIFTNHCIYLLTYMHKILYSIYDMSAS